MGRGARRRVGAAEHARFLHSDPWKEGYRGGTLGGAGDAMPRVSEVLFCLFPFARLSSEGEDGGVCSFHRGGE